MNILKYALIILVCLLFIFLIIFFYKNKENITEFYYKIFGKDISINEIRDKKSTENLWTYYNGYVYDLTKFVYKYDGYEYLWKIKCKNLKHIEKECKDFKKLIQKIKHFRIGRLFV